MSHRKVILGAAAFIVSVWSSLAFKASHKLNGGHQIFVKTRGSACLATTCYSTVGIGSSLRCHTIHALGTPAGNYFTALSGSFNSNCIDPKNTWTHVL